MGKRRRGTTMRPIYVREYLKCPCQASEPASGTATICTNILPLLPAPFPASLPSQPIGSNSEGIWMDEVGMDQWLWHKGSPPPMDLEWTAALGSSVNHKMLGQSSCFKCPFTLTFIFFFNHVTKWQKSCGDVLQNSALWSLWKGRAGEGQRAWCHGSLFDGQISWYCLRWGTVKTEQIWCLMAVCFLGLDHFSRPFHSGCHLNWNWLTGSAEETNSSFDNMFWHEKKRIYGAPFWQAFLLQYQHWCCPFPKIPAPLECGRAEVCKFLRCRFRVGLPLLIDLTLKKHPQIPVPSPHCALWR